MRGENGTHFEIIQRVSNLIGRETEFLETLHSPERRSGLRRFVFLLHVLAPAANAMNLFRCVDEKEKEGERARSDSRNFGRQLRCTLYQLIEALSVWFSSTARAAASPQPVDYLKRFFSLDAVDYAAKRSAEIPDVFVKWKIFGTDIILRFRNRGGLSHRE